MVCSGRSGDSRDQALRIVVDRDWRCDRWHSAGRSQRSKARYHFANQRGDIYVHRSGRERRWNWPVIFDQLHGSETAWRAEGPIRRDHCQWRFADFLVRPHLSRYSQVEWLSDFMDSRGRFGNRGEGE